MWRDLGIFSCRQATRLASDRLDRRLTVWERLELAMHLAMCGACRACARQLRAIDLFARRLLKTSEPPGSGDEPGLTPEAKLRMTEAVNKAQSGK
ncbi:MAG: zf-HC2 domain-containing protein [Phycisphaerae bacterium]